MDVPLSVWLYAAAVAASVPILWYAVGAGKAGRKAKNALATASSLNFRDVSLARPVHERIADGALGVLGSGVKRLTPVGMAEEADRRIARAGLGHRWTADRLLTVKALLAISVFAVFFILALGSGSSTQLILGFLFAFFAFVLPDIILIRTGDSRQNTMRDELSDVIDQVVIAVEAGLSFDGAVDRVARNGEGPLEQELQRVMQDIALGLSRKDALMALADRSDIPELRELVLALAQSEEHGLPISRVLRVQADEVRDKRRARAEERAMKVPVKIVFPLILCILPCIAAVIVGPALVRITQEFEGRF